MNEFEVCKKCEGAGEMCRVCGRGNYNCYCPFEVEHLITCPQCNGESVIKGKKIMSDTEYDVVNKPKHYNDHPSGIQCIEITRHMCFNLGNAFKYVFRAGSKGDYVEDLKKARWYLKDATYYGSCLIFKDRTERAEISKKLKQIVDADEKDSFKSDLLLHIYYASAYVVMNGGTTDYMPLVEFEGRIAELVELLDMDINHNGNKRT